MTTAADIDIQAELDAQRRELEVEYHRKLTAVRDEMEKENRTQLRRQAAAHVDHISDVLEVQSKELTRIHERSLDETINNEKASHKRELAIIRGTLQGYENALEDKKFMINTSLDSQEFWLACVALQNSIQSGVKDLGTKIKAVEAVVQHSAAFQNDELLQTLLGAIPKEDVCSASEIKARFNKVEEMAKRTALIGEEGGSLLLYGLSFLQNMLMISPSKTAVAPKSDQVMDVDALSTFDIVWLAGKAMEADDLEQAVKYMNLLKGEPRRQASGWLKSARLLLEMQQISESLNTYASAIGAEALSRSSS
jgi:mitofilin